MNKKSILVKFLFLFSFFLFLFACPKIAAADTFKDDLNQQTQAFAGEQGAGFENPTDPRTVVAKVISMFLSIIGVLFLVYGVYAGSLIMLSGGEREKIDKGKSTLRTAVIGVLVVLSAYSIMRFIITPIWNASQSENQNGLSGDDYSDYNP